MNKKFLKFLIVNSILMLIISIMYDKNLFVFSHTYYCCMALLLLSDLISSVGYIITLKNIYVKTIEDLKDKLCDMESEISIRNGKITALENDKQKLKSELNERNVEICRISELLKKQQG